MLYPLSYGGSRGAAKTTGRYPRDGNRGPPIRWAVNPAQLSTTIVGALTALVDDGRLTLPDGVPSQVTVERPRQKEHGDYATNVALQLAKRGRPPTRGTLAEMLAEQLRAADGVAAVDVAGPGFLNITVGRRRAGRGRRRRRGRRAAYGSIGRVRGREDQPRVRLGQPDRPAAHRRRALGSRRRRARAGLHDDRCRGHPGVLLQRPRRPDRPVQRLAARRARGRPVPEDGYGGAYIDEIAQAVLAKRPDALDLPDDEAQEVFRAEGVEMMFAEIKESLHQFGVDFDVYFHEDDLHASGAVQKAIDRLTELGNTYEQDGALWLRTEKYGDDKDRVIIRSDGNGSYFSGDLAYYLDKRSRGFDRCFIMLGADHHGYVGRMMAMCAAFGDEPHVNLEILIGQMVNLRP